HPHASRKRVGRVNGAVGTGAKIVQKFRVGDPDARRLTSRVDVEADDLIDVGDIESAAIRAHPLRRIEALGPIRVDDLSIQRELDDAAVAVARGSVSTNL